MSTKKVFITGITGQDGSYLAEMLLDKGYEVHGLVRRTSLGIRVRIDHIYEGPYSASRDQFRLHYGDMTDTTNLTRLIGEIQPDEIYNLAAQSHVGVSFETPEYTANADALGTLRILEAVRVLGLVDKTRIYQASTSELYGKVQETPQSETTPFYPRSPYAVAKLYAYWAVVNYREAYGMYACNGILFNHESPRRGNSFVTKKIAKCVSEIKKGQRDCLYLGNMDAKRDWGYAPEYVQVMWMMLQQDQPEDFVIATGEMHSVREFVEASCRYVDINLEWKGSGIDEVGINSETGSVIVAVDPHYYRPTEVDLLLGDCTKAKSKLGWEAQTKFKELVNLMMEFEMSDHAITSYVEDQNNQQYRAKMSS